MKFLVLIGIAVFFIGCKSRVDDSNIINKQKPVAVRLGKVEKKVIDIFYEAPAIIEPWQKVYLVPAQPGRIEKIFVEVSDRVKEGQLLVQMDATQYNQTYLQFLQLNKDFTRYDSLIKVGAITQQQYDQIKTNLDVIKNNLNFLDKNINLKSPFDGIVTAKLFENGEMYTGAPNTREGKAAVLILEQTNYMKVNIDIPERYYTTVKLGNKAHIQVDVYKDKIFEGIVTKIYPTIDISSKTFKAEIKINNNSDLLRSGMFAKAKLYLGQKEACVVPSIAVLKQQGGFKRYLFTVENNKAKQIFVNVVSVIGNDSEIESPEIQPGMNVVIVGQEKLVDGTLIENK
ncbi:MAG: efflux RND transporter periplasmic adaptor subunit [Bacteroidales bacterium]|nr:efflux RND transporter periplasmic adaptor subunit [Bacteroidales bacterium]